MRARTRLLTATGLAAVLLAAGWGVWRMEIVHRQIEASLPARPALTSAAPEFVARLDAAEAQAHGWWHGAAGLAELSRLYHANGFLPEAARTYEGLITIEPAEARWPHLLGVIHTGFGQLEDGLPLLRRAVALAPGYAPARLKLGDALFKEGAFPEAAASYRALLELEPANSYGLLGLARCDLEAGHLTAARDRLRDAVNAHPSFASGWTTLATLNERLGDAAGAALCREAGSKAGRFREMADPWLDELIDDCYDVYRIRIAASVAASPAATRRLLERAVEIAPANAALRRQLGSTLVELGEIGQARGHYERAVALDPDDADNWAYYVQVLAALGDLGASDRALADGLARCPTSPSLRYEHGRRLAAAGRVDEAVAEFRETRRLRPYEANASVELAMIDFRRGKFDAAVAELHTALAAEPEHPFALETLAKAAIQAGDEAAARDWLRRVRLQPRIPGETADALAQEFQARFQRAP